MRKIVQIFVAFSEKLNFTQKNIFAHVDLTKNLDFLDLFGAAFCFKRAEKFVRK